MGVTYTVVLKGSSVSTVSDGVSARWTRREFHRSTSFVNDRLISAQISTPADFMIHGSSIDRSQRITRSPRIVQ